MNLYLAVSIAPSGWGESACDVDDRGVLVPGQRTSVGALPRVQWQAPVHARCTEHVVRL